MTDEYAKEFIEQIKRNSLYNFILILVLIFALVCTNLAWLYVWSLPVYETAETYELEGEDSSNVIYNSQGDVKINGDKEKD